MQYRKKYGVDNIMKSKLVSSKFKGDNHPMAKDPEIAKKISKTYKEYYKTHPHPHKGKTYKEIMGPKRAAERIEELRISGVIGHSLTPIISKPQQKLYQLVKNLFPQAIMEYPIGDYCIDIALPNLKIAIEYDGSYWHNKEKDRIRDKLLKKIGWATLRFEDYIPTKKEITTKIAQYIN